MKTNRVFYRCVSLLIVFALMLSGGMLSGGLITAVAIGNYGVNLDSTSYAKSNPFFQSGLKGQCTWYAWGRAHEKFGINLPCRGHAKTWADVAAGAGYNVNSTPTADSIAVWTGGTYGHVAYVERVEGSILYLSESNYYGNKSCKERYSEGYLNLSTGLYTNTFGSIGLSTAYRPTNPSYIHLVNNLTYSLDVNITADSEAFLDGHDAVTFDVYLGDGLAADNVRDYYNNAVSAGTGYRVVDVNVSGCWRLDGPAEYAGTINGNTAVTIPIVTAHTPETIPGFEATCTEPGLTDGEKCSVCGAVLTEQTEIPALEHAYEETVIPPTCDQLRKIKKTCSRCGDSFEITDPALFTEWSEEKVPEDAVLAESKTQYRSAQPESQWQVAETGEFDYAEGWPAGFDTGHALYAQYNKTPVQSMESETEKIEVTTSHVGYIYWHWCYGTYEYGPINRTICDSWRADHPCFFRFLLCVHGRVVSNCGSVSPLLC